MTSVADLNYILGSLRLDESLENENNRILHNFLQTFVSEMIKVDDIFEGLFQEFHYTGSYFQGLRILRPSEFDINLVLNLSRFTNLKVDYHYQIPSFAKCRIESYKINDGVAQQRLKQALFSNDSYLIPGKVRSWFQSVIQRALTNYQVPNHVARVRCREAGPARTFVLTKYDGSIIEIDLVPVFSFMLPTNQPGIDGRVKQRFRNPLKTFLVPKPFSCPYSQPPINSAEEQRLWRIHFPDAETEILHSKGCAKSVIKLLKLLRDNMNWGILSSYSLKTVVMWMILKNPSDYYWRENNLKERFVEALRDLQRYVASKNLPYFFSSKFDLIHKINYAQACDISQRLQTVINSVDADPVQFRQYMITTSILSQTATNSDSQCTV